MTCTMNQIGAKNVQIDPGAMEFLFAEVDLASLPMALGWLLSLTVIAFMLVTIYFVTLEFMRQNVLRPESTASRKHKAQAQIASMAIELPGDRQPAAGAVPRSEIGPSTEKWRNIYDEWKRF